MIKLPIYIPPFLKCDLNLYKMLLLPLLLARLALLLTPVILACPESFSEKIPDKRE